MKERDKWDRIVRGTVFAFMLGVLAATGSWAQTGSKSKGPQEACTPTCNRNIGELMMHPTTVWQTVTADCGNSEGCNDCFIMTCPIGTTVTLSFCQGGGTASFDTGISAFLGPFFESEDGCVDDFCGIHAELSYTFTDVEEVRFRVGGFGDESGQYTLAYMADTNGVCFIDNAVPVELMSFDID